MRDCIICDGKFEKNIIFENENMIIMLSAEPSVNGHIQIFSKSHYTILEQVPNDIVNSLISASNKVSMILFEVLKVHGTNIIINNGVPAGQKIPHFSIDIIPRRNDDSLKLDWELKQASPESLDTMHRIITEGINPGAVAAHKIEKAPPLNKQVVIDITANKPDIDARDEKILSDVEKSKNNSEVDQRHENKEKRTNYHHRIFDRIP